MKDKITITKGLKEKAGKLRMDLIPTDAFIGLAEALTYGASKYEPNSWQPISNDDHYAALLRHIIAWRKGDKYDDESGLSHLKHALSNVMFLLYKENNEDV